MVPSAAAVGGVSGGGVLPSAADGRVSGAVSEGGELTVAAADGSGAGPYEEDELLRMQEEMEGESDSEEAVQAELSPPPSPPQGAVGDAPDEGEVGLPAVAAMAVQGGLGV